MQANKKDLKYWAIESLPWIFSFAYLSVCIYLYKERITYGDTGYYLFKIIQKEGFNIEHNRVVSILSQFIPIILVKLSAPMRIVMIGYSVNFALIYMGCFFFIKYVLKSTYLAWGALLCSYLFLHYGFYYPNEMLYSSAIILLIVAFLTLNDRMKEKQLHSIPFYGIDLILLMSIAFIHPLYYIVMCAILLCLFLIEYNKTYLYFIVICIVFLTIKTMFFQSGYESGKMASFDLKTLSWQTIDKSYLTYFWKNSFSERFYIAKFSFFAFILSLFFKRKWLLALTLPIVFIILYLIVYLSMPNGEALAYMEGYLVTVSVFPLVVLLFYLEKNVTIKNNFFVVLCFVISIFGLTRMAKEPIYKDRVNYLEAIFAHGRTNNISKFFIEDAEIKHERILVGWALPYETLILSTVSGKTQTIFDNYNQYKLEEINQPNLFLGAPWEAPNYNLELNQKYFQLDSGKYVRINGMDF